MKNCVRHATLFVHMVLLKYFWADLRFLTDSYSTSDSERYNRYRYHDSVFSDKQEAVICRLHIYVVLIISNQWSGCSQYRGYGLKF